MSRFARPRNTHWVSATDRSGLSEFLGVRTVKRRSERTREATGR
jgi:hypothetical protein